MTGVPEDITEDEVEGRGDSKTLTGGDARLPFGRHDGNVFGCSSNDDELLAAFMADSMTNSSRIPFTC